VGIREIAGLNPAGKPEKARNAENKTRTEKSPPKDSSTGKLSSAVNSSFEGRKKIDSLIPKLPDHDMVRREKVDEIKAKVENGFYDDPSVIEKIADLLTSLFKR